MSTNHNDTYITDSSSICILPSLDSSDDASIKVPILNTYASSTATVASSSSQNKNRQQSIEMASVLTTSPEKECAFLEKKCDSLIGELKVYKEENAFLKSQCKFLKEKLDSMQPLSNPSPDASNIATSTTNLEDTFVDVKTMLLNEKIENHLLVTNKQLLIGDKRTMFKSMDFLISGLCDILDNECKSSSINAIKHELLSKINYFRENENTEQKRSIESSTVSTTTSITGNTIVEQKTDSDTLTNNKNSLNSFELLNQSLNNELTSCKIDAESLKSKVLKQNSLIKDLINELSMERLASTKTNPSTSEAQRAKNTDDDEEYNTPSPGTSPSSYFLNRFEKFINNRLPKEEQIKPKTSNSNNEPAPNILNVNVINTENSNFESETQTLTDQQLKDDVYLYNLNGFIAIDNNKPKNLDYNDELAIFKCPKCQTSVDAHQINLEKFEQHLRDCNLSKYNVCMFCLCLFEKSNELYEEHVNSHLSGVESSQDGYSF